MGKRLWLRFYLSQSIGCSPAAIELKKSAIKNVLFCECFAVGFKKIKSITRCVLLVVANTSKRKTVKNKSASMVAFFGIANVIVTIYKKMLLRKYFLRWCAATEETPLRAVNVIAIGSKNFSR